MNENLKENYMNKANNLIERLMDEAPEDEVPAEDTPDEDAPEETPADTEEPEEAPEEEEEKGQAGQVEIYFDNLDKDAKEVLLNALKENLNAAEDDKFANQKLIDVLSKEPLVTIRAEELIRKLDIKL
jgi:hypothetical protein